LDILHIDFTDLRGQTVTAGDAEQTFTLRRLMMISGSVVEAQSGTPINIFRLVRGRSYSPDQRISWSYRGTEAKPYGGTFEFTEGSWPSVADQRMLRVEAEGYLPAELPIPQASDRPVVLDFKLSRAADLNGTIVDPQGRPASGILVVLGTASQGIAITDGALDESSESPGTRTDSQGRFRFPAQREQFLLVAACDAGYAEVPGDRLPPAGRIELKPWGTIRGRLMVGDKPGALQRIVGEMDRVVDSTGPQVYKSFDSRAASDGRFTIERVPPGSFRLAHLIIVGDGRPAVGSSVHLTMEAAGTADVLIGGTGRPVTGRVAVPLTLAASPNSTALWGNLTENPIAGGLAGSGLAARAPESFVVPISPDGSFRVEDVPAGNYRFDVGLYNPPPPNTCGFGELLASAIRDVVVPEMPGGRSDQPLVVDSIQLQPSQIPKAGDAAPELSVAGLDGKTILLSDYRGKYVLIDFWATWCAPCVQELPVLQRIHDTFGKDPRFAMLGLSLDQTPEALRNFVASKGINWQQGYVGAWGTTRTPDQWGANNIPAAFLISPDGKIIATQLRGEAVGAAVAQALHVPVRARPTQPIQDPGTAGAGNVGPIATTQPTSQTNSTTRCGQASDQRPEEDLSKPPEKARAEKEAATPKTIVPEG
jgi:peroxiredoxin